MTVTLPDNVVSNPELNGQELLIEVACRLYDADLIPKGRATRLTGLSRVAFEEELIRRGLPIIRYTDEMWAQELRSLEEWEAARGDRRQ
jgi:predicted HTH domain antitoxin